MEKFKYAKHKKEKIPEESQASCAWKKNQMGSFLGSNQKIWNWKKGAS